MEIKLPSLTCLRCAHVWTPRQTDIRICPNCKSARWDTPRRMLSGMLMGEPTMPGGITGGMITSGKLAPATAPSAYDLAHNVSGVVDWAARLSGCIVDGVVSGSYSGGYI